MHLTDVPLVGREDPSFVFPMDAEARIDTLLLGCTHYPLLAPAIRAIVGEAVAVIDSASATASALASLLEIHALGTPDKTPGRHVMLTTGDVEAFARTASRLFGEDLDAVEGVDLAAPMPPAVARVMVGENA